MSNQNLYFLLLINFLMSIILACSVVLFIKASRRHSLRTYLATGIYLIQVIGILFITFSTIAPDGDWGPLMQILDMTGISSLLPVVILFTCYIIEVKIPGTLSPLKILVLFSPLIPAILYMLSFSGHFTRLSSAADLTRNIGRPDVIARIVVNVLYEAYTVFVLAVRSNDRQNGSGTYIALFSVLNVLDTTLGIAGFGFGITPCLFACVLTIFLFDILIFRFELSGQIQVAEAPAPSPKADRVLGLDDEVWKDPELSAEKLSKLLGMNQRYLSDAIKQEGYSNYTDMVNSKRVGFICKMIDDNPEESSGNLSNWMYDAGFRSRNTAINAFKKIKGCTPSEYRQSCLMQRPSQSSPDKGILRRANEISLNTGPEK